MKKLLILIALLLLPCPVLADEPPPGYFPFRNWNNKVFFYDAQSNRLPMTISKIQIKRRYTASCGFAIIYLPTTVFKANGVAIDPATLPKLPGRIPNRCVITHNVKSADGKFAAILGTGQINIEFETQRTFEFYVNVCRLGRIQMPRFSSILTQQEQFTYRGQTYTFSSLPLRPSPLCRIVKGHYELKLY